MNAEAAAAAPVWVDGVVDGVASTACFGRGRRAGAATETFFFFGFFLGLSSSSSVIRRLGFLGSGCTCGAPVSYCDGAHGANTAGFGF